MVLSEDNINTLVDIFYREAPYDYVVAFVDKRNKHYKGVCYYDEKVCVIFKTDSYYEALETVLHELAHATIQHKTHSAIWEKELVRLLKKHNFPRELAGYNTVVGPSVRKYIDGLL